MMQNRLKQTRFWYNVYVRSSNCLCNIIAMGGDCLNIETVLKCVESHQRLQIKKKKTRKKYKLVGKLMKHKCFEA